MMYAQNPNFFQQSTFVSINSQNQQSCTANANYNDQFDYNSNVDKGKGNNFKGKGGKGRCGKNFVKCQLYGKPEHEALQCWHRFELLMGYGKLEQNNSKCNPHYHNMDKLECRNSCLILN
ncbi:hypothetical protein RIF29_16218 [Crotalaria pallida]|uniref:Uncharacterized protein n=1 Tax=Crotalaria pallida TaxID=3830 RepID=A0AAN9IJN0_CROPI